MSISLVISAALYAQERISSKVYFQSGEQTIEGILIRPHEQNNTPVVVFQQGSGNHSFDGYEEEAWGPHGYYIEEPLLEQGYAVLYCNKRGLGGSTGKWKKNDFYGRAEDAYAAVNYLKTLSFIDSTRIGVSGHSQGGWIAQITAAEHKDIAFIICLAGPTIGVEKQMDGFNRYMYACKGLEGEKLTRKVERKRRTSDIGAWIGKVFPFLGGPRYWYLISEYQNNDIITNINCPTLLLFAEYDVNVDPEQNIDHLNGLFGGQVPDHFTVETMPRGQHGFYVVEDRCVDWETAVQQDFDPGFQEKIREWIIHLD
jgi:dienelactone hydrolase